MHSMLADCTEHLGLLTGATGEMRTAIKSGEQANIVDASRRVAAAIFILRLDVPEMTTGILVYKEGPQPSVYWASHHYGGLEEAVDAEQLKVRARAHTTTTRVCMHACTQPSSRTHTYKCEPILTTTHHRR